MNSRFYLRFLTKKLAKPAVFFLGGSLLAVFLLFSLMQLPDGRLHLKIYDVGQGDAIFIKTPKGNRLLVDGGPGDLVIEPLSWDLPLFDRSLDLVLLTHPHADHVGGLTEVLRRFKAKNIVFSAVDVKTATFRSFLDEAARQGREGAKVSAVKKGDRILIGGVTLNILWPENEEPVNVNNENNLSIVSQLNFGNFNVFLPGDQEKDEFGRMAGKTKMEAVEVLKVAHHGSKNGLDRRVLETLRPQIGVISAGRGNKYGHPSPETINLLDDFSAKIYRTDVVGTVEIVSDGSKFWLEEGFLADLERWVSSLGITDKIRSRLF